MSNADSRRMRFVIGLAGVGGAFLAGALPATPARACSLVEPPQPVTPSPNPADDAPPVLKSARLEVRRASDPGSSSDGDGSDATLAAGALLLGRRWRRRAV
jgi:hypothetical protein